MAQVFSDDVYETNYSNQQLGSNTSRAYAQNQWKILNKKKCRQFLQEWRAEETFLYREKAKANYHSGKFCLEIDCSDISAFDKELGDLLFTQPSDLIEVLEDAALEVIAETLIPKPSKPDMHPIQIQLKNFQRNESLRSLRSSHINKLVCTTGIITSAYKVQSKAVSISIKCASCNDCRTLKCPRGFGMTSVPRVCASKAEGNSEANCDLDPYIILPDSCTFIDCQKLRLQELPEDVPTGEIPSYISLSCERELVQQVNPGTRVKITGIFSIFQPKSRYKFDALSNVRIPYIQVVGIEHITQNHRSLGTNYFSPSMEEKMINLSRDPELYSKLAQSLAPKIYGHEDIKKAIVCMLFGGTKKVLPSNARIRGDINILLLGDPSVAKSQLLKCTDKTAPISVYTSGKGISAAGLTACVVQNSSGDFHLEGGAMVLADGGCVCVDEFDKMREDDRVAIHEAMEQQTISIAKAGITTVLNSRTSVLAAANPTFGRYDDSRKAAENIDFETTILSRFDLIFIIRDVKNTEKDKILSLHVLNIHMQKKDDLNPPQVDPQLFTQYITYCRENCHPKLSKEAAELLQNKYVAFRKNAKKKFDEEGLSTIPVSIRQLEAIIRMSEARAKLQLSEVAGVEHVKEALRLFQVATMAAVEYEGPLEMYGTEESQSEFVQNVQRAERHLRRRIPIGSKISFQKILNEMVARNHSESAVRKALNNMRLRGETESMAQGKLLMRKR